MGYGLYLFFETSYAHEHCVRNSMKVIIVLGCSFLLIAIEGWLEGKVPVSGLLAAEVVLFVLVGAAVDIRYMLEAGIGSVPLAAGLPCGKIILSVAVLAILITAPIGAIGIDSTYKRFLEKQKQ